MIAVERIDKTCTASGFTTACVALATVVLTALPVGAPGRETTDTVDECRNGLLYVGDVRAFPSDPKLEELIGIRIAEGLRFGRQRAQGRGADQARHVVSYHEVVRMKKEQPAMRELLPLVPEKEVVENYQKIVGISGKKIKGYVQGTVLVGAQSASVEIDLTCLEKERSALKVRKAVRSQKADEALLQAVFVAAEKLARGSDSPPVARASSRYVKAKLEEDAEVEVDGGGSSDPDDDAFVLTWKADSSSAECSGWRQEGARLRFRPHRAGTCRFTLLARELVERPDRECRHSECQTTQEVSVEIEALAAPRVRVSENSLLPMTGPTWIQLAGFCDNCEEWQWTQLAGPVSTMPVECNGPSASPVPYTRMELIFEAEPRDKVSAACRVAAPAPGEYTFALVGRNRVGSDRKEYTVGVAPPPAAVAYVPSDAVVGHTYTFDGTASHDIFGGTLHYYWEVSDKDFEGGCLPRSQVANSAGVDGTRSESRKDPPSPHFRLGSPTSPTTSFVALTSEVTLYARLTTLTSRKFGDRSHGSLHCAIEPISVKDATWLFGFGGGDDVSIKKDGDWAGFRMAFMVTWRPFASVPKLGLRGEQTVGNDGGGTKFELGRGTLLGVSYALRSGWQAYLSGYGRPGATRGGVGAQLGVDIHFLRFAYLSGGLRTQARKGEFRWFATGTMGVGYDL